MITRFTRALFCALSLSLLASSALAQTPPATVANTAGVAMQVQPTYQVGPGSSSSSPGYTAIVTGTGGCGVVGYVTGGVTCGLPISNAGSAGADYSANTPTLPNVGASTFGGSTSMAAWVKLATVPAGAKNGVRIAAAGGQRIAWIEDDGSAAIGAARINATLDLIDPGAGLYTQGGDQALVGHNGRIEIYGPTGTFVAVRVF